MENQVVPEADADIDVGSGVCDSEMMKHDPPPENEAFPLQLHMSSSSYSSQPQAQNYSLPLSNTNANPEAIFHAGGDFSVGGSVLTAMPFVAPSSTPTSVNINQVVNSSSNYSTSDLTENVQTTSTGFQNQNQQLQNNDQNPVQTLASLPPSTSMQNKNTIIGGSLFCASTHQGHIVQQVNVVPGPKIIKSFNTCPSPKPSFTGRAQILLDLHNLLMNRTPKAISMERIVVLSGLGGIGKTETSRKYAFEYKLHYGNNIAWVNAENYESLKTSFVRLASILQISSCQELLKKHNEGKQLSKEETKDVVQSFYQHFVEHIGIGLLIFDNAVQMKSPPQNQSQSKDDCGIFPFLPQIGGVATEKNLTSVEGYYWNIPLPLILITSQNQTWNTKIPRIALGQFHPKETMAFLQDAFNIDPDYFKNQNSNEKVDALEKTLQNLGAVLQHYPLGLTIASSTIQDYADSNLHKIKLRTEEYIRDFQKPNCSKWINQYSTSDLSDYDLTLANVWSATIKTMSQSPYGPMAIKLLNLLSYLSPNDISIGLCCFIQGGKTVQEEVIRKFDVEIDEDFKHPMDSSDEYIHPGANDEQRMAIRLLRKFSMINVDRLEYKINIYFWKTESLRIHRLVQKTTREKLFFDGNHDVWLHLSRYFMCNSDKSVFLLRHVESVHGFLREKLWPRDGVFHSLSFLGNITFGLVGGLRGVKERIWQDVSRFMMKRRNSGFGVGVGEEEVGFLENSFFDVKRNEIQDFMEMGHSLFRFQVEDVIDLDRCDRIVGRNVEIMRKHLGNFFIQDAGCKILLHWLVDSLRKPSKIGLFLSHQTFVNIKEWIVDFCTFYYTFFTDTYAVKSSGADSDFNFDPKVKEQMVKNLLALLIRVEEIRSLLPHKILIKIYIQYFYNDEYHRNTFYWLWVVNAVFQSGGEYEERISLCTAFLKEGGLNVIAKHWKESVEKNEIMNGASCLEIVHNAIELASKTSSDLLKIFLNSPHFLTAFQMFTAHAVNSEEFDETCYDCFIAWFALLKNTRCNQQTISETGRSQEEMAISSEAMDGISSWTMNSIEEEMTNWFNNLPHPDDEDAVDDFIWQLDSLEIRSHDILLESCLREAGRNAPEDLEQEESESPVYVKLAKRLLHLKQQKYINRFNESVEPSDDHGIRCVTLYRKIWVSEDPDPSMDPQQLALKMETSKSTLADASIAFVEAIEQAFEKQNFNIVVLHGPPGVGKTRVAEHFMENYSNTCQKNNENPKLLAWLNCTTYESLKSDIISLGTMLKIINPLTLTEAMTKVTRKKFRRLSAKIYEKFTNLFKTNGGLFIFDDADPELFINFPELLPPSHLNVVPKILITSRSESGFPQRIFPLKMMNCMGSLVKNISEINYFIRIKSHVEIEMLYLITLLATNGKVNGKLCYLIFHQRCWSSKMNEKDRDTKKFRSILKFFEECSLIISLNNDDNDSSSDFGEFKILRRTHESLFDHLQKIVHKNKYQENKEMEVELELLENTLLKIVTFLKVNIWELLKCEPALMFQLLISPMSMSSSSTSSSSSSSTSLPHFLRKYLQENQNINNTKFKSILYNFINIICSMTLEMNLGFKKMLEDQELNLNLKKLLITLKTLVEVETDERSESLLDNYHKDLINLTLLILVAASNTHSVFEATSICTWILNKLDNLHYSFCESERMKLDLECEKDKDELLLIYLSIQELNRQFKSSQSKSYAFQQPDPNLARKLASKGITFELLMSVKKSVGRLFQRLWVSNSNFQNKKEIPESEPKSTILQDKFRFRPEIVLQLVEIMQTIISSTALPDRDETDVANLSSEPLTAKVGNNEENRSKRTIFINESAEQEKTPSVEIMIKIYIDATFGQNPDYFLQSVDRFNELSGHFFVHSFAISTFSPQGLQRLKRIQKAFIAHKGLQIVQRHLSLFATRGKLDIRYIALCQFITYTLYTDVATCFQDSREFLNILQDCTQVATTIVSLPSENSNEVEFVSGFYSFMAWMAIFKKFQDSKDSNVNLTVISSIEEILKIWMQHLPENNEDVRQQLALISPSDVIPMDPILEYFLKTKQESEFPTFFQFARRVRKVLELTLKVHTTNNPRNASIEPKRMQFVELLESFS